MDCYGKIIKDTAIQTPLSNCRMMAEKMVNTMDSSEITITFKQKYRDMMTNEEISLIMRKYFRFLPLNHIRELILIPEYGQNKNLHYHGIIRGKASSVSELKGFLNRRFGRTTITTIRNTEQYLKYILKEQTEELSYDDYIYYNYE